MSAPRSVSRPPTLPEGAARNSVDAFIQTIIRSRLIDRPHLDEILTTTPVSVRTSSRDLADHLIVLGELTHYQTEKLLHGLWQGLVLGPYRILAPLGRGGMGTVYLARDHRASLPEYERGTMNGDGVKATPASLGLVAIKILPPKRAREEERSLARFRREMELGKLMSDAQPGDRAGDHPNLTRTIETGEMAGVHYIVLEYVPGQSLKQAVTRSGPLSVPDAARVFMDVADGLTHAHARGLIHRDMKPSNIMVTLEGHAKILDLGLAILMGEKLPDDPAIVGGHGYILGTMDYIAPEQTTNATDVGPWSDIYSMGCSLYFALTGVPPFPGGTSQQKIKWHRHETPPSVDTLNASVPAEFVRLVERMMAKRPGDRPETAATVWALLSPWAGDRVAGAKGKPAPHNDREAVATFDSRSFDPSLWDHAPIVDLAQAPKVDESADALGHRNKESAFNTEDAAHRRQAALLTLATIGIAVSLMLLAVVFGLLRRL